MNSKKLLISTKRHWHSWGQLTLQGLKDITLTCCCNIKLTSLYLTNKENLRKSDKSEFPRELKHTLIEIPGAVPRNDISAAIIFDKLCHKVPVKKLKSRTYEYLLKYLWSNFKIFSSNVDRSDIVHVFFIRKPFFAWASIFLA